MKALVVAVVILLLLGVSFFCLGRAVSVARRAWKRRNEGGFWAAQKAVAKEDHESYLARKQAKAQSRAGSHLASGYDPETGEVYDDAISNQSKRLEEWEASLVHLWRGSIDIEFTYESRSERTRRKVTLQNVLRNERGNIYLRGFCHAREDTRTFSRDSIATMLLVKGKRYDVEDFVVDVLGVSPKQLGWE